MSTIRVNAIQNTTTTDGGISIDNSGHVTVDGQKLPSAGPLSNRNLIINGAMQVAQRGTSEASLTDSPKYLVDRFAYRRQGTWGTNSFTMSQQSSGAPNGFTHFLRLAQSGTAAAPPTDTWCGIGTYLEGNTVYQAGFGTSAAQPLTLSFWVKASQAGTYSVSLSNGSDQTFIHEYSVTSSWQRITVPITARTTGTWATDNTSGFLIHWVVAADSDGTHSASTGWNATLDYHGTNQIETFASTSGATFDLAGVQLEVGSVATPFEHRSFGQELALCQRYYQKSFAYATAPADGGSKITCTSAWESSSNARGDRMVFPVQMRATPTITPYGTSGHWQTYTGSTWTTATSTSTAGANERGFSIVYVKSGLNTGIHPWYLSGNYTASAEL